MMNHGLIRLTRNKCESRGPLGLWGADPDECDKLGKCMSPGVLNPATLHSGLETVKPPRDAVKDALAIGPSRWEIAPQSWLLPDLKGQPVSHHDGLRHPPLPPWRGRASGSSPDRSLGQGIFLGARFKGEDAMTQEQQTGINTPKLFPPSRALHYIEVAGQRYQPSNGTEGMAFIDGWCSHCARDKAMRDGSYIEDCDDTDLCPIIARSMADGGCKEWVYGSDGQPRCTEFVEHGQPIPYRCPKTPDLFGEAA